MTLQGITEEEIANYLVNTPAFFERHAQLLASITLSSPHGGRAVSLQERQMEMLRDKIRGLEKRIMDMIRLSQENEAIVHRLHLWVRSVLLCHDDAALPDTVVKGLQDQFLIPQAAVRIWGTTAHPVRAALAEQGDSGVTPRHTLFFFLGDEDAHGDLCEVARRAGFIARGEGDTTPWDEPEVDWGPRYRNALYGIRKLLHYEKGKGTW